LAHAGSMAAAAPGAGLLSRDAAHGDPEPLRDFRQDQQWPPPRAGHSISHNRQLPSPGQDGFDLPNPARAAEPAPDAPALPSGSSDRATRPAPAAPSAPRRSPDRSARRAPAASSLSPIILGSFSQVAGFVCRISRLGTPGLGSFARQTSRFAPPGRLPDRPPWVRSLTLAPPGYLLPGDRAERCMEPSVVARGRIACWRHLPTGERPSRTRSLGSGESIVHIVKELSGDYSTGMKCGTRWGKRKRCRGIFRMGRCDGRDRSE